MHSKKKNPYLGPAFWNNFPTLTMLRGRGSNNHYNINAMSDQGRAKKYWSANIQLLSVLLVIWFLCSFGSSILFKDQLDQIQIGGFPLGFWFAQQGSIYVFVLLIFVYVRRMIRLDKTYGFDEDETQVGQ